MKKIKKITNNSGTWYDMENPVSVTTDSGEKVCERFYFNGFEEVIEITLSDGKKYQFTANHRLRNSDGEFVYVLNLDVGDTLNTGVTITDKKMIGVRPTMDMEVPEDHYYILDNGVHSHNSSFILGVSEGVEMEHGISYIKDLAKGKFRVDNPYFKEVLKKYGKDTEEVWDSILVNRGSVQHLDFLSDHEKEVFKTFLEADQRNIIRLAGERQRYIDQGQSLNIVVRQGTPVKEINALHLLAHEVGLKSLYYQINTNAAQEFTREILCESCSA